METLKKAEYLLMHYWSCAGVTCYDGEPSTECPCWHDGKCSLPAEGFDYAYQRGQAAIMAIRDSLPKEEKCLWKKEPLAPLTYTTDCGQTVPGVQYADRLHTCIFCGKTVILRLR